MRLINLLLLTVFLCGCNNINQHQPPIKTYNYTVKVCSSIGCDFYDADTVIRKTDTYVLYIGGKISTEIKGPIVIIEKQ